MPEFLHGQNVKLKDNTNVPDVAINSTGKIVRNIPVNISFQELKLILESLNSYSQGEHVVDFPGKGLRIVPLKGNSLEEI
jgi:hypothetical protein